MELDMDRVCRGICAMASRFCARDGRGGRDPKISRNADNCHGRGMLKFNEETTRRLWIVYQGGDISRRRRMAFDALHLSEGDTVVDIGCGNGLLTKQIARATGTAGRVIGVDPSADMRTPASARCAAFSTATIKDGQADALPIPDGSADKAIVVQVLEYLPDIPADIGEAYRVLRPGGRFVAVDIGF
jgi:arsenite methyltransferase